MVNRSQDTFMQMATHLQKGLETGSFGLAQQEMSWPPLVAATQ